MSFYSGVGALGINALSMGFELVLGYFSFSNFTTRNIRERLLLRMVQIFLLFTCIFLSRMGKSPRFFMKVFL